MSTYILNTVSNLKFQHVSGDIALSLWKYWCATKDELWLRNIGFPMLEGIATFWQSRVVLRSNQYVIYGVVPPDEFAGNHGVTI